VRHATVPHLPTLADGLWAQEVVAAAERADAERRWVDLAVPLVDHQQVPVRVRKTTKVTLPTGTGSTATRRD